jgi:hypothetical protein
MERAMASVGVDFADQMTLSVMTSFGLNNDIVIA